MIYNMKAAKRPPNMAKDPVATFAEAAPVAVTTPEPVLVAEAPELKVTLDPEGAVQVPLEAVPLVAGTTVGTGAGVAVAVVTVLK